MVTAKYLLSFEIVIKTDIFIRTLSGLGLLYITPQKKYHKCTNITNLMKIEIECLDGSVLKDTFFNVQVSLYKE